MTDVATGNALSPSDVEPASGPYVDHEDHVDDHVRWIGKVLAADPAAAAEAQRLAARVAETRARDHRIPLLWMQDRLGLSNTEMAVVWLLLAHELDPDARAAVRELNTEHVSDATFDTIRRVVYGLRAASRTWRELGPDGKLRSLGLLERTDGNGDAPQQRQTFKIARRVLALAHGVTAIDPAISQLAKLVAPGVHVDALELPHGVVEQLRAVMTTEAPQLVLVVGCQGTGRRSVLLALAARPVLVVDGRVIAPQRDKAQQQLAVIARECRLLGCIPLFQHVDALAGSGDILDRLDLLESALDGLTLATSTKPIARRWQRPPAVIVLGALSGAQRARLWRRALPQASDADAELLATMYPLAPALIEAAGRVATRQCGQADMQPAHIEAGIRSVLDHRLAGLADRVTVTQSWKDLVLPEDQTTAMLELLARIRERRRVYEDWGFAEKVGRGLGVTALFSGPPGTGKTMAAGLVASSLRVELYRVDISRIVSKWIGETEKNLATLFDAAEAGHAIRCSDSAPRSAPAMTATRTRRSTTCCSAWSHSPASAFSRRTTNTRSTRRSGAGCRCRSDSRFPRPTSASSSGARCCRKPRRSRATSTSTCSPRRSR